VSYLRKILLKVDPSLPANKIAEALVQMCEENRVFCAKYLDRVRDRKAVLANVR
jgi:hypothetical protein